jgi:hypothetical protein
MLGTIKGIVREDPILGAARGARTEPGPSDHCQLRATRDSVVSPLTAGGQNGDHAKHR